MSTLSRTSHAINQDILAMETIFYLHRFLVRNNRNPAYNQLISLLGNKVHTASTCGVALSFFRSAEFDGGSYRIKVGKQQEHFQYLSVIQDDIYNFKYELFIISEAAKRALEGYKKRLEFEESKTNTHQRPLIPPSQEHYSCTCIPTCHLF